MSEVSRLRIHRSLTATLMVLVFLLLLAFSIFWGIGFMLTWTAASIEEAQRTDSGLAKDFAALLQPHITPAAARAHSAQEINRIAFDFQQSHRNVSIYLLDLQGNVLWTPGEGEGLRTKSVDIAPVASFLNGDELPIYGTNPAGKRDSVFAAAAIDLYGAPGYVYLTLANNRYEAWTNFFLVSSSIRLFLILTIVVAVILGAIGALAIYFVTRRFRDVADVLRRYRGGDFSKRLDASGHDELAEVSDAVNSMLDTVEDQLAQLRKKDLVRRELISNIWHDLKTPVTAIRGHLELLEQRDAMLDSGQRLELVEILRGSTSMLQSMLVDLYDLGRLEAKDIEPATVRCELGELCDEVVAMFRERARVAQIALTVVRDDEGCDCRCDPDLMLRVLSNLIDNAIRHTPPHGEVRIELVPVGDRLQISVSDTGAGIPQASIPFLFERYFQIDADGAGKGSAGLGLAIVKRILEAHHTSIEVVSSVDSGTTFRFSLPSYRIPENHHPQPPSAPHA